MTQRLHLHCHIGLHSWLTLVCIVYSKAQFVPAGGKKNSLSCFWLRWERCKFTAKTNIITRYSARIYFSSHEYSSWCRRSERRCIMNIINVGARTSSALFLKFTSYIDFPCMHAALRSRFSLFSSFSSWLLFSSLLFSLSFPSPASPYLPSGVPCFIISSPELVLRAKDVWRRDESRQAYDLAPASQSSGSFTYTRPKGTSGLCGYKAEDIRNCTGDAHKKNKQLFNEKKW